MNALDDPADQPSRELSLAYPGWRVVVACFTMAVFSWAFSFYGQGVYLAELHARHGWSVASISGATTAFYLLSAVLVVFVGDAIARLGSRTVLCGGIVLLAASLALAGWVETLPGLYGVYALLSLGWAGTGVAAITTAIGPWFDAKRGLAISLALNGASLGGVIGVPVLVTAIDRVGFAPALALGAAIMAFGLAPVVAVLVPASGRATDGSARAPTGGAVRARTLRSPPFWTISGPFAAALLVQVGFVVHQITLITQIAGAGTATLAVSITAIAAVVGRLALGAVIDRLDVRRASAASFALQAIALVIALRATSGAWLLVASGLFGLSVGNVITLPALIVHREFDRASFATVVALSTAVGQFVYAFGPGAIGWLRDASGGYGLPLTLCAAIDAAAAAWVLAGRAGRPGRAARGIPLI